MSIKFLAPHRYKIYGWIIAIPASILMIAYLHYDFVFPFLEFAKEKVTHAIAFDNGTLFNIQFNNFTDEIGGIVLIIGLVLIAFSKEKDEDERILQLRLESLLWATLINTFLISLSIIFFYNQLFLKIIAYNICSTLILFIIRFNLTLY